ncbi:SAM domain-containing protein [Haematococcus lacustris]|uniref:SAM domain-containing protein n=1 Tax=Haematococcus lacustris TaxID=44745 RepID=A0A699ZFN8_HAELA|nr:SAM domain-containing protein [Haematococcus lacustris]
MLASWWQDGVPDPNLESAAVLATSQLLKTVQEAVNRKQCGVRALQTAVCTQLQPIIGLARLRHSVAYLALQILCYRNSITCQQICDGGIVEEVARSLSSIRSRELQGAMCYLLTGMVAFSEATHAAVISSGLVPQLVALCRCAPAGEAGDSSLGTQLQQRAAAVLRNLAHNTRNHGLLINAGAHPAARINAAVAVACLVGHEEGNPRLQLDEQLVVHMLQVLGAACQGIIKHEAFWTVWKLCQGLASLAVNDSNKELIARNGGVQVLAEVLFGKHHNNEAAHRYALSTLWNLAFVESSRAAILAQPGLVDAIRTALNTTESARTKEVAKGCLAGAGREGADQQCRRGGVAVRRGAGGVPLGGGAAPRDAQLRVGLPAERDADQDGAAGSGL